MPVHDFHGVFGDLSIDGRAWEVKVAGRPVDLTPTEFDILVLLASKPRIVLSEDEIVTAIWGENWFGDDNNLAVHVSKLRTKLGESGTHPRYIRTVRGVGYRFDPHADSSIPSARQEKQESNSFDSLRRHPNAVEIRVDRALRVTSVFSKTETSPPLDPHELLSRYLPPDTNDPTPVAAAQERLESLIAGGVCEWSARHVVTRHDGSLTTTDLATFLSLDNDGQLRELRFVIVEHENQSQTVPYETHPHGDLRGQHIDESLPQEEATPGRKDTPTGEANQQ